MEIIKKLFKKTSEVTNVIASYIKNEAKRLKEEGRIEDANFAEELASLYEEAAQQMNVLVDEYVNNLENNDTDKADVLAKARQLSKDLDELQVATNKKFVELGKTNPALYAKLTNSKFGISKEEEKELDNLVSQAEKIKEEILAEQED